MTTAAIIKPLVETKLRIRQAIRKGRAIESGMVVSIMDLVACEVGAFDFSAGSVLGAR